MHVNRVVLLGTLANDPSVTFTEKGTQSATFTILVEESGMGEATYKTFIPCQAYGKSAEKIGDLSRGDVLLVEGKLSWRKGTDEKPAGLAVFVQSAEVERQPAMAAVSAN